MLYDDFDPQTFLPYLLNQAAEAASLEFTRIYKERYGMLRTEWRVLFHLGIYETLSAKEIGQRAKIHKTKISRAVSSLEKRRYLERERVEQDKRFEALRLTPLGRTVYADLKEEARRYETTMSKQLSEQERTVLRGVLLKLVKLNP